MDSVETLAFARSLIDTDSTTGNEAALCEWLAAWLRARGYTVVEQPVRPGAARPDPAAGRPRANLLATTDSDAVVLLSTHLDCVPPFFPSAVDHNRLIGRGACDAKGILAAQVSACERLRASGEHRVGLLFVVGEERGSDGAKAAAALAPRVKSSFVINGEPTESMLAAATRGVWRMKIRAHGRAAHSAYPELGDCANTKLLDTLIALREVEMPADPALGRTSYVIGLMSGGIAPNVVSPVAEAEITFRTVGPARDVLAALESFSRDVEIEHVLDVPVEHFHTVPGFETQVFPFTTDAPFLHPFGRVLLFGPGSIRVAHTDQEHIDISELNAAVESYERLARTLLGQAESRAPRG